MDMKETYSSFCDHRRIVLCVFGCSLFTLAICTWLLGAQPFVIVTVLVVSIFCNIYAACMSYTFCKRRDKKKYQNLEYNKRLRRPFQNTFDDQSLDCFIDKNRDGSGSSSGSDVSVFSIEPSLGNPHNQSFVSVEPSMGVCHDQSFISVEPSMGIYHDQSSSSVEPLGVFNDQSVCNVEPSSKLSLNQSTFSRNKPILQQNLSVIEDLTPVLPLNKSILESTPKLALSHSVLVESSPKTPRNKSVCSVEPSPRILRGKLKFGVESSPKSHKSTRSPRFPHQKEYQSFSRKESHAAGKKDVKLNLSPYIVELGLKESLI